MKNFKPGGFKNSGGFGGRQKFGGGGDRTGNGGGKFGGGQSRGFKGGDRDREQSEMFSAVCSTCGRNCEVPFRPSNDKPVYCSACFGKKSQEMSRDFGGDIRHASKERHDFKPDVRPSFKSQPARSEENVTTTSGNEELKRQLTSLEGKVNRILDMLNAQVSEAFVGHVAVVEKEETVAKKANKSPKKAVVVTSPKGVKKETTPTPKKVTKVTKVAKVAKVAKKAKK